MNAVCMVIIFIETLKKNYILYQFFKAIIYISVFSLACLWKGCIWIQKYTLCLRNEFNFFF